MDFLMTPAARQAKIANIIRQQNRVTVNELAEALNISRETIRRDLTALAQKGKAQKFHGGASLPTTTGEGPFGERMGENVGAKVQVAAEAVKLVSPGETIFIDTGSTSLYFAEKIVELSNLTVITNSAEIARIISLSPLQSQAFLLGGKFNGSNRQTVGNFAISQIQSFRAHHAILTIGALDVQTGVMDFSIEEAQIAQAMTEQAESLTIIADSSKFGRIASFKVCGLDRITNLVCDQYPSKKIKSALLEANVNIIPVNL
jgi:DeoR/GlpR family transcriptional regulator of sugar metabolism